MRDHLRRAASVVLAAVALACARPHAAATAPASVDVERYARLLQMTDARRLDTAFVRGLLGSPAQAERLAALRAIGQTGERAMEPDLVAALAQRDTAAAATGAFALGLLRDTAAVPALAAALGREPTVAASAAWALGRIAGPASPAIRQALSAPAVAPAVRQALLLAAARLEPVPASAVVPFLSDTLVSVRWSAAYALARSFVRGGVRPLLAHVEDPGAQVRAEVARGLDARATGDSLADTALAALARLAADRDPHVRIQALRALASHGAAARAAVLTALRDSDANVRVTAAQALSRVLGPDRRAWLRAFDADTSFMFRRSVLISALRVDVVLPALDEDDPDSWRHRGDWRYRATVADAGAAAPSIERMREVSLPAANDPDPRVRVAGYDAMAPHADSALAEHPWRRQFMYVGLHDYDAYVRAVCIESLVAHASAAEVPRVLAAYRLAERDTVDDARVATARFLASAWARDSAAFGDSLVAAIRALPVPADPLVREASGQASILAPWRAAAAPPPHPLAWYADRVRALVLPALAGVRPQATIRTVRGPIVIALDAAVAPLTVDNFIALARSGYYSHLAFHRVVPGFVAQDGDHRGDGNGGPPWTIRDELNRRPFDRGAVGMALSGADTGGSQYFITLAPQPHLDGGYTVFGHVVSGYPALDALVQGDSITAITVP